VKKGTPDFKTEEKKKSVNSSLQAKGKRKLPSTSSVQARGGWLGMGGGGSEGNGTRSIRGIRGGELELSGGLNGQEDLRRHTKRGTWGVYGGEIGGLGHPLGKGEG